VRKREFATIPLPKRIASSFREIMEAYPITPSSARMTCKSLATKLPVVHFFIRRCCTGQKHLHTKRVRSAVLSFTKAFLVDRNHCRSSRTPSPCILRRGWSLALAVCMLDGASRRFRPPSSRDKNPGFRDGVGRHFKSDKAFALSPRFGLSDCVDPGERPTVGSNTIFAAVVISYRPAKSF
jgi:hypothetical protein